MLHVQGLSKWYENVCVFRNVDFQLKPGQCLHLRGVNGSGKSTLLRLLSGLEEPTVGKITLGGQVYLLPQKQALKKRLSVYDHLLFWKHLFVSSLTIEDVLALWGLAHLARLPIMSLSLGQCKRLQLCQLELTKAKAWLLDEPHHGLDHAGLLLLKSRLQQHLDNKGCIVLAHHGSFNDVPGETLTLNSFSLLPI